MSNIFETEAKIKQIIDELKALSAQAGLANQGEEERIITSVFLYKFLNDKFMYNLSKFAEEIGETIEEILKNENDELDAFYDTTSGDVAFGYEDTIQYLINHVEQASSMMRWFASPRTPGMTSSLWKRLRAATDPCSSRFLLP